MEVTTVWILSDYYCVIFVIIIIIIFYTQQHKATGMEIEVQQNDMILKKSTAGNENCIVLITGSV